MRATRIRRAASPPQRTAANPLRQQVLGWYKKILSAAFTVDWLDGVDDGAYVLDEARRLFRQNMHLRDVATIQRKVREAETRYALATHYRIPRPRMFHKIQGAGNRGSPPYAAYLDSYYDGPDAPHATNRVTGWTTEGSTGKTESLGATVHQPSLGDKESPE
jgi:hypothetical protein